jgi:hypothetical protein
LFCDLALRDRRHLGGAVHTRRAAARELNRAEAGKDSELECVDAGRTLHDRLLLCVDNVGERMAPAQNQRANNTYRVATTATTIGVAIVILRRTARSCAAPRACHAVQRSSKDGNVSGSDEWTVDTYGEAG